MDGVGEKCKDPEVPDCPAHSRSSVAAGESEVKKQKPSLGTIQIPMAVLVTGLFS